MVNKIQPLCSNVVTKLRSGINLTNVAHCVEELVLNSIDAGASCIAVNLNLPIYQIQVVDNGCGMDLEQLRIIGTRYVTSKCHSLEDLQNLKSGGFRGEALSSLKEVSSIVMIESRTASSKDTYCKIFTQGSSLSPKKSINSRPSKGTTVSIHDFMYNMPVRRNSFSSPLDLEECRKLVQGIALMHPDVSFTLKNDVTGEMCLQIKKSSSLCHSFCQIFGKNKSNNLKNVDYKHDCYEMNGCVSTDCHVNKDLQFLYVNKRRVLHTKLHKFINNILNKALNSKQRSKHDIYKLTPEGYSPTKTQALFCIYVLNISCSYDKYDIIFEPRKTMIEFSEWDKVLNLVEGCLVNFLKKENLCVEQNESTTPTCTVGQNDILSNFDTHDCRQGLFSHIAKRFQNNLENCIQESDADNQNFASVESYSRESSKSSDEESNVVCLKSDMSNVSVLDSLKMTTVKAPCLKNPITASAPLLETGLGIPRRSVFPSKSPVMLRIPVRSTLSDLQAGSSNSDFYLKLKEKFKFSLERRNKVQDNKKEKNTCALNLKSQVSFKHNISHKSHLSIHQKKPDAKGHGNSSNLKDKSSQCPSVSSNLQNMVPSQFQNNPISTCDKSFQCPSISLTQKTRTISRFQFRKEFPVLSSKHLEQPGRLENNSKKNQIEECIAVAESLLESVCSENEVFKAKKLKLSEPLFSDSSNDASKEYENSCDTLNINFNPSENFMNNRMSYNTEKFSRDTCDIPITEVYRTAAVENEVSYLNHQNTTCFSLQTFNIATDLEHSISTTNRHTNLDTYSSSQREDSGRSFSNDDIFVRNVNNYDSISDCTPREISIYEAEESSNVKNNTHNELDDPLTNKNLQMEIDMQREKQIQVNDNVTDILSGVEANLNVCNLKTNSINLCTFEDNYLLSSPCKNAAMCDEIIEGLENVASPIIEFQYKPLNVLHSSKPEDGSLSDSVINVLHSHQTGVSTTVSKTKLIHDVSFDSEPFTESLPSFPNPVLQDESQDNLNNILPDTSITEVKLAEEVNLESESFSKSIPFVPSPILSFQDRSKENFNSLDSENFSNSKDRPKESQFSELSHMEVSTDLRSAETDKQALPQNMSHNDLKNKNRIFNEISAENSVFVKNSKVNDSIMLDSKHIDSCSGDNKHGMNVTSTENDDKHLSRWKPHAEPETSRMIYIDSVTGNSTYKVLEKPSSLKVNMYEELSKGLSKRSHFFLTHDCSPFIPKTQTPKIKEVPVEFQKDFKNFVQNSENYFWSKKWRTLENENCDDAKIECMLKRWENPMFEIPYEVTTVGDKSSLNIPQMYTFLNSYKFSQNTLKSLQVIGQVDCKFIACILQNYNKNSAGQKLLALFDQHAVHERIMLEELITDLQEIDQTGEKIVRSTSIFPPIKIPFDSEEIRLLRSYQEKLHQIGIRLEIEGESHVCSVYSVPSCLVNKGSNQLRRSREDSLVILQNAIIEWLSSIVKTRSISQVLPKTLLSVLNSQACRGAVKFGDPLSFKQCCDLLKSLSECKLPFQCAHGRPSVAPLLDMNKIQALYKKRPHPQLSQLSDNLSKEL